MKALINAGRDVILVVRHDKQPAGLCEIIIDKVSEAEPIGIHICGGIGSPPAIASDPQDEGIFVDKVHSSTNRSLQLFLVIS